MSTAKVVAQKQPEVIKKEINAVTQYAIETYSEPFVVLDTTFKVLSANKKFYETFHITPNETIGQFIYEVGSRDLDIPKLHEFLEKVLPHNKVVEDYEIDHQFKRIGEKVLLFNARYLEDLQLIFLTSKDVTEFKRLEKLRLEGQELYEALFFASQDAVMTLEPPSWRFTSGNPATFKMFSAQNEPEFLSYEPWKLSPTKQPDGTSSTQKAKEHIETAMREGSCAFEWTHKRITGEPFLAHVLLSRVEVNKKIFLHAVVRDITDIKRLEEKIVEYEKEKFKVIFENTTDGMLVADTATKRFILGNKSIGRMLGYSQTELPSLSLADIHPKDNFNVVTDEFTKLMTKQQTESKGIPVKRKDGSTFLANITASPIVIDGKQYMLGIFKDVTDEMKALEDLRVSEEKYRTVIGNLADGIFIIDDGNVTFINNAFATIAGYSAAEVIGKSFLDFIAPDFKDLVKERYYLRLQGQNIPKNYEIKIIKKDGLLLDVTLSARVVPFEGKKVVMGVLRDISERKRSEKEFQELAYRQKTILQAVPDILMEVDVNKKYTWTNKPGLDFFGNDVLGHAANEYFVASQNVYDIVQPIFEGKDDTTYVESWQRRKDGKSRLLAWYCRTMKDEKGIVTGALSSARDITDERTTQLRLKENEQFLRLVVDLVPHFIFAKDMESRFILANKAVAEAYGTTTSGLIGKSDSDFSATPEQAAHFHADDLAVITGGKPKFIPEELIKDIRGKVRYLQTTKIPFFINNGTSKGLLGVSVDITEQKQLREKIIEDKSKDEAILESIGDAVFACDIQGTIIMFNKMAEQISGVSTAEALGRSYHDILTFIKEDDEKLSEDFIGRAIKENVVTKMANHTLLVRTDGTKIPVSDSAAPVKNAKGDIIGCVVAFHDVTREREIDKAKTEFVSLASHQLRTPLTTINWYSESLIADGITKLNEKQQEYLKESYRASKRMVKLIDALLNVSRLELGTFSIEPESVNIQELVDIAIKELDYLLIDNNTMIHQLYDPSLPTLQADRKLLGIVISNLLSNAVKYTPSGGRVDIEIVKQNDEVLFTVRDTGIGIPKDEQKKIFTKLFRATNAKKVDVDGTGLGLYIVRSIILNSGGKIWFDSDEHKGTTFYVTLPLSGMAKKTGSRQLV